MSDCGPKWFRLPTNGTNLCQNVLKNYLQKSQICSIWCQSDPLWSQTYHPWSETPTTRSPPVTNLKISSIVPGHAYPNTTMALWWSNTSVIQEAFRCVITKYRQEWSALPSLTQCRLLTVVNDLNIFIISNTVFFYCCSSFVCIRTLGNFFSCVSLRWRQLRCSGMSVLGPNSDRFGQWTKKYKNRRYIFISALCFHN